MPSTKCFNGMELFFFQIDQALRAFEYFRSVKHLGLPEHHKSSNEYQFSMQDLNEDDLNDDLLEHGEDR